MQNMEFVKGRRYRFEPIKGVLVHSDMYRSGVIEVTKIVGNTVFCNILEGVITEEKFDVFDKDSNIAKCLFDDLYDCIEEDNSLISFLYSFIMIKNATFTSVWDGGYEVTTNCKVNMETKEVFDIESVDVDVDILEREYVTVDGVYYSVSNIDGYYTIK